MDPHYDATGVNAVCQACTAWLAEPTVADAPIGHFKQVRRGYTRREMEATERETWLLWSDADTLL